MTSSTFHQNEFFEIEGRINSFSAEIFQQQTPVTSYPFGKTTRTRAMKFISRGDERHSTGRRLLTRCRNFPFKMKENC